MTGMRAALALVLFAAPAGADTSVPAAKRWASCARAIEAARRQLGERYSILRDAEVAVNAGGVSLSFEQGWCMHHTSGKISVEPTRGGARGWRRQTTRDGYTAERRVHGLHGIITYFDRNESESSGDVDGLDEALQQAFAPAIDRCLSK